MPAGDGSNGSLHRHKSRWESLIRPFAANSYSGLHRSQFTGADALSSRGCARSDSCPVAPSPDAPEVIKRHAQEEARNSS